MIMPADHRSQWLLQLRPLGPTHLSAAPQFPAAAQSHSIPDLVLRSHRFSNSLGSQARLLPLLQSAENRARPPLRRHEGQLPPLRPLLAVAAPLGMGLLTARRLAQLAQRQLRPARRLPLWKPGRRRCGRGLLCGRLCPGSGGGLVEISFQTHGGKRRHVGVRCAAASIRLQRN